MGPCLLGCSGLAILVEMLDKRNRPQNNPVLPPFPEQSCPLFQASSSIFPCKAMGVANRKASGTSLSLGNSSPLQSQTACLRCNTVPVRDRTSPLLGAPEQRGTLPGCSCCTLQPLLPLGARVLSVPNLPLLRARSLSPGRSCPRRAL